MWNSLEITNILEVIFFYEEDKKKYCKFEIDIFKFSKIVVLRKTGRKFWESRQILMIWVYFLSMYSYTNKCALSVAIKISSKHQINSQN